MSVGTLPDLFAPAADAAPVPLCYAAPVQRLAEVLQENALVFVVRVDALLAEKITCERLECHLQCVLPDPVPLEIWPLLPGTWAVALHPSHHVEPFDAMQVHALHDGLNARLRADSEGSVEAGLPSSPAIWAGGLLPFFLPPPIALPASVGNHASLCDLLAIGRVAGMESVQNNLSELNSLLEMLVNKQLRTQFQPLVSLRDGQTFAYEALIRGTKASLLRNGGRMFHAADKAHMVGWFDLACLEQCFKQAAELQIKRLLFVNMEAEGLAFLAHHDRPLAMLARESGLSPSQIVIEITERQTVGEFDRLIDYINQIRDDGFRIAIDDAGAGYNSLNAIAELRPEFVKIDRELVQNVHASGERRALIAALTRYAHQIGTAVLGEGIEEREELAALIDLGLDFGQGYLMAKPSDELRGIPRHTREFIRQRWEQHVAMQKGRRVTLGGLATAGVALNEDEPLAGAARAFAREAGLTSVVVVDANGCPRGLVAREQLEHVLCMAKAAHVAELLPDETVAHWMHTAMLVADEDALIPETARQATTRSDISLDSDVVVVRRTGGYLGVVPMRLLLEAALQG